MAGSGRSVSAALLVLVLAGMSGRASAVSEVGTWMLTVDSVSFLVLGPNPRSADGNERAARWSRTRTAVHGAETVPRRRRLILF